MSCLIIMWYCSNQLIYDKKTQNKLLKLYPMEMLLVVLQWSF